VPLYNWINFAEAKRELAVSLGSNDPIFFWGDAELGAYLTEALRVWNLLNDPPFFDAPARATCF